MTTFLSVMGQDLWRATWQGGLFVLGVFVICRVFRRLPASTRYWLWWLACLQFPLRLLFISPIALPLLAAKATHEPVVAANSFESDSIDDGAPLEAIDPVQPRPAGAFVQPIGEIVSSAPVIPEPIRNSDPVPPSSVLLFGWGVGCATVLVLATRRLIRTRRMLRESRPVSGEIEILANALSAILRVRPPGVRESAMAPCPLLTGWLRSLIVLPSGFGESRDQAELRMTLAHELAHLKRRDLWLAGVPLLTQSLFFFHPLAWLAIRESAAACEEACDLEAMRLSGGSPSAYARLLLSSVPSETPLAAMGTALGFRLLHRRITMLSQSTPLANSGLRKGFTALIALGVLCSIPWTVTAQTKPKVTKPAKKAAAKKRHHVVKGHAAKAQQPIVKYFIDPATGKRLSSTIVYPGTMIIRDGNKVKGVAIALPAGATAPAKASSVADGRKGYTIVSSGGKLAAVPATAVAGPSAGVVTGQKGYTIVRPGAAVAATATEAAKTLPGSASAGGVARDALPAGTAVGESAPTQATTAVGGTYEPLATAHAEGFVSIDIHDIDIVTALRAMFKAAGVNFAIKSTVQHDKVTCGAKNVPMITALNAIFASAKQNLEFINVDGVVVVQPKN